MNGNCRPHWLAALFGVILLGNITTLSVSAQDTLPNPAQSSQISNSPEENFQQGNVTLAIQQWTREIREGTNVARALYNRSQAYILLEQFEFAAKDLDQLFELPGVNLPAEAYVVRGVVLTEINQLPAAIESFNQAERLQASPLVYNNRAITYQRQGQLQLALADLQKSVEIAPVPTHLLNLANLQIQLGEYDQAVKGMNQILRQDAQFFPAYLTRGIAYFHLNQIEKALKDLVVTLEIKPDQAEAFYYAGLAFAKLNRPEEATQNLVQAANLHLQQNKPELYHQVLEKMTELNLQ